MKRTNDSYMTDPAFWVSKVSGIMGIPASSFTGEMLAAQRIEAMLMKRDVLAMRRPRQILRQRTWIKKTSGIAALVLLPVSKALLAKAFVSS